MARRESFEVGTLDCGTEVTFVRGGRIGVIELSDEEKSLPRELVGGFTDQQKAKTAFDSCIARIREDKRIIAKDHGLALDVNAAYDKQVAEAAKPAARRGTKAKAE